MLRLIDFTDQAPDITCTNDNTFKRCIYMSQGLNVSNSNEYIAILSNCKQEFGFSDPRVSTQIKTMTIRISAHTVVHDLTQ